MFFSLKKKSELKLLSRIATLNPWDHQLPQISELKILSSNALLNSWDHQLPYISELKFLGRIATKSMGPCTLKYS